MRNHKQNMFIWGLGALLRIFLLTVMKQEFCYYVFGLLLKVSKPVFSFLEIQCAFSVSMSLLFVRSVDKRISECSLRALPYFHFCALQSRQPRCCIAFNDLLVFLTFLLFLSNFLSTSFFNFLASSSSFAFSCVKILT